MFQITFFFVTVNIVVFSIICFFQSVGLFSINCFVFNQLFCFLPIVFFSIIGEADVNGVTEVMAGVRDFFDATVGRLLLYKIEKPQFHTFVKQVKFIFLTIGLLWNILTGKIYFCKNKTKLQAYYWTFLPQISNIVRY
jgi:hypothetical protein